MILENNLVKGFHPNCCIIRSYVCTWVYEHNVQHFMRCLWRVFSPHCQDICADAWSAGSCGVPSFSPLLYLASVSAGKICRKSQNYFWSSGVFQQQLGASSGQLRPSPGPQMSHAGPGPSQNQFQSETVRFICIISPEANLCLLEMQLKLPSRNSDNNTGMTFEK